MLEAVIAVCAPSPAVHHLLKQIYTPLNKTKTILWQEKQEVALHNIVAVKEAIKSLLWPKREK